MTLLDLAKKFRAKIGDGTADIPTDFIISAFNWAINDLPTVPRLEKLFSFHEQVNLDAKDHYKWKLNGDFRALTDIPMLNFYSSKGGDPCPIKICNKPVKDFYEKNGLVNLKKPGTPCEYTIEREGDDVYLVLDRPSDVPIIVDYIAYGIPKPATDLNDAYQISAVAEMLILNVMTTYYLHEADDYAQAADITSYLDNKKIIEAIQLLNRNFGSETPRVLGEV